MEAQNVRVLRDESKFDLVHRILIALVVFLPLIFFAVLATMQPPPSPLMVCGSLIFLIYYIYDGYLRLLQLLYFCKSKIFRSIPNDSYRFDEDSLPSVTVLVTVFNEENSILEKIKDILKQDYPINKLSIVVASDGSTDNTDRIVSRYNHSRVSLFRPIIRKGKSDTQNQAIRQIKSDIIMFTDSDTRFEPDCIKELIHPFKNPDVGCTSGKLLFSNSKDSDIASNQSFYWNYELQLRDLESKLGCLATATGACMSIRTHHFKSFSATYGEDCIVPLDTVIQGLKVVHVNSAVAYDQTSETQENEFKARVRMTLRNWQGIWSRPALLNPLSKPKFAFTLWSHKLLRWLTPIFILFLTAYSLITSQQSWFSFSVSAMLIVMFSLAILGYFAEKHNKKMPRLVSLIHSFIVANTGFLVGIWQASVGKKIGIYNR